ncbi:MAG: hypothetical protein WCK51_05830 [Armatimonadota bacterium]
MKLSKKRIRTLEANIPAQLTNDQVVIVSDPLSAEALHKLGFPNAVQPGMSLLPAIVGPVSRYNAEGKWDIHRDQPKETCYRQVEWKWIEKHGQDEVEQSRTVDVPYQRYPRTLIPPPCLAVTLIELEEGMAAALQPLKVDFQNGTTLKHALNLFLEMFGSCTLLRLSLEPVQVAVTHQLNWSILPPGEMPWGNLKKHLAPLYEGQSKGRKPITQERLEFIAKFTPSFTAVGTGGFSGYIVFGFPDRNLYIVECTNYGNATYVFRQNWETLSQLTKAEILVGELQEARYIHREKWHDHVRDLFK